MESTTYHSESEYLSQEAIDELRTTEERYRLAHEATNEGVWDWNLLTNIVFVSERWSGITGYTKGDPENPDPIEYWYSRIHPDDRVRVMAKREAFLKENITGFEEYRFFHNSGNRRWLRSSIKMKYNEQGKPVRMIGSLKDITDRKEAEEALLESENKFRKLLKYSPVLFYKRSYVSDKYEYVSPAVYDILGFAPDEFTHFSFDEVLEYVHSEDLFSLSKAFHEAITVNNGQFQSEYRMKCKNGEYIWVFDMAHISTDSYNKPVSITGSIINITSRKMVEAAIKQSEEELNYAQEISKMGSWELNLLTGEQVFSRNQFKILGLPEDKVKISYNDFLGFVHPDDLHLLEEKLEEIKRNRTVQYFEFRLLLPDGTIKWLEYYVVPVFKEDTLIALKGVNIDISGKRQIQDELRDSERKYQNLVENISDAVYEFDSKGVITYITPMIEKISGYSPDEIIGTSVSDFLIYDEVPFRLKVEEFYNRTSISNEHRVRTKSGEIHYIRTSTTGIFKDGIFKGGTGTLIDVTHRKVFEKALLDSEKRFREALQYSPTLLYKRDFSAENYDYVSQAITSILDYTVDEFTQFSFQDVISLVHPEDIEIVNQELKKAIDGADGLFQSEYRIRHKNGKYIWVYDVAHISKDANNKLVSIIGSFMSISKRKEAEKKLQKLTERLSIALENGKIGIWEMDVVNNKMILDDNMLAFLGIKKNAERDYYEVWRSLIHPDDQQNCLDLFQNAILNEKEFNSPYRIVREDGEILHFLSVGRVKRDSSGKAISLIGTNYEVTDIKRADEEIRLINEDLLKLNAEKDKFFSIIAHDLRGPVSNFIQVLNLFTDEEDLEEIRKDEFLVLLKKIASATLNLLENLLNWSRCQTNTIELNPKTFLLNDLLVENTELVSQSAGQKSIKINLGMEETLHAYADKISIDVVLRNLLANAVKFTRPGGNISISACRSGHQIIVEVKDDGVGMEPEMADKIFKPETFFSTYGTGNEKGSGIGLKLCKEFVHRNGGVITVTSSQGLGSIFAFSLNSGFPGIKASPDLQIKKVINSDFLSNKRILLVEDDIFSQSFVQSLFSRWKVTGNISENGKQAIELLQQQKYDLILMDIEMLVLDGFSTARIIREEMGLIIPIIAISANSGYDFAQAVREAGMNDYLRKPFSPELLFTSILKVLGIEYSGIVEKKPRQTISKSNSVGLCNIGKLKEVFGDDPVQLKLMISKFLELAPGYYEDLLNGYGNGDLKAVRRSAHKLKPSVELFSCKKMVANIITIHSLSGTEENSEKLLPFINIFRDSYPKFCDQLREELHQIT